MLDRDDMLRKMVALAIAAAALLFAVSSSGQTTRAASSDESAEADASTLMDEMPDLDAGAAREALDAAKQRRRAFREAIHQAKLDRLGRASRDAAPETTAPSAATEAPSRHAHELVARDTSVPALAHDEVIISFAPPRGQMQNSPTRQRVESPFAYSVIAEGEVAVEARVARRDAAGQPVAISAAWNAADPSTVEVVPATGSAVTVIVRGTGQSNLTVVGPGFTKDLLISATAHRGTAIRVDISD